MIVIWRCLRATHPSNLRNFASLMDRRRLHRNLLQGVWEALHLIFFEEKPADKVVEEILKANPRWGSRDRGFVAEATYDLVRYRRRYLALSGSTDLRPGSIYPMIGVWADDNGYDIQGHREFEQVPAEDQREFAKAEIERERSVWESVPDWLDDLMVETLGVETWAKELKALNEPAPMVLRVNRLQANAAGLGEYLKKYHIPSHGDPDLPDAVILEKRANVFSLPVFKEGWFEMQDGSSQRVGHFLQVGPGMRVVDACAGAGGKTLQLASLMENSGQLIALDIYEGKLRELKRRARRARAHNIEPRLIESNKTIKRLHAKADRLLLDVPCTGLGVLRRNPDTKWKLRPEFLPEVQALQQKLLCDYSRMLKPGGMMVYATCSILPAENEHQVRTFLESEAGVGFELQEERHCWPSRDGYDGFYMARLSLKEEGIS